MQFILKIELGNDAMQDGDDVVKSVRDSMKGVEHLPFEGGEAGVLWDANGNTVGRWEVIDETACAVCGKPAAEHGHWSATDPSTHKLKLREWQWEEPAHATLAGTPRL